MNKTQLNYFKIYNNFYNDHLFLALFRNLRLLITCFIIDEIHINYIWISHKYSYQN